VPSIVFGKSTFDPTTRRVVGVKSVDLVAKDGKWAVWDGKRAVAAR
jgi:branched-chain amino acid transport system substrate-binding protein